MEQYNENQYDDDLTVGTDEYEDSYRTDAVDLFEFSAEEESPIGRLKGLILSIDWEITDEILMQFNEELIDLKDIWADEKINLVYVQALEKISKYIYQKKVNSHPNAIKLLLTLYYNLEKIVSSEDLTKQQKKDILLGDVKRFESLKRQIANQDQEVNMPSEGKKMAEDPSHKETTPGNELLGLKATVLGIDWEITEEDLGALRQEVVRLEEKYADNRPRLILLQGIGTLGAYIKVKQSNAHADAFKLLHLFFESLEKIVGKKMNLDEEKMILLPAVEKFNAFKSLLGSTISPDSIRSSQDLEEPVSPAGSSDEIQPAFADIPYEDNTGFQEEAEAKGLGYGDSSDVSSHINDFFGESSDGEIAAGFGEASEVAPETDIFASDVLSESPEVLPVDRELALQGVNVEFDDDEAEEGLEVGEEGLADEILTPETSGVSEDDLPAAGMVGEAEELEIEFDDPLDTDFTVDKELALQGVDVETEADDDSDEDALPVGNSGILAPALDGNEEVSAFSADSLDEAITDEDGGELSETLDGFFENEQEVTNEVVDEVVNETDVEDDLAIISDVDQEEIEESDGVFDEALTVELERDSALPEDEDFLKELGVTDDFEEKYFVEEALASEESEAVVSEEIVEQHQEELQDFSDALEPALTMADEAIGTDEKDQFDVATVPEESDFTADDHELPDDVAEDILASGVADIEEQAAGNLGEDVVSAEIDSNLDAFFGLEDGIEEPDEADLLFSLPESGTDIDEVETESLDSDIASEDVVFELADDELDQKEDEPDELAFAENAFLADEEVPDQLELPANVEDKVEDKDEEPQADEADEVKVEAEDAEAEVEVGVPVELEVAGDEVAEEVDDLALQSHHPLGTLNECIESIGLEIDDKIIDGLYAEINHLRQLWATKSLEKSFLQLLSTVTQHIDQRRFDSSPEAYGLLQSACGALYQLGEGTVEQDLDLLLSETSKVLQWQQNLLNEPVEPEPVVDVALTETVDEGGEDVEDDEDDPSLDSIIAGATAEVDDIIQEGQIEEDAAHLLSADEDDLTFHDDLRKEISSLRTTLQSEIAALRKELKDS